MTFSMLREDLLTPVSRVIGVVERKQSLAILSNVLITQKDNILSVSGIGADVSITGRTPLADPIPEIHTTLPAYKLLDILKSLPPESRIQWTEKNSQVTLSSGASRFTLSTLPAEDFPVFTLETGNTQRFAMPQSALKKCLQDTTFTMAQQDVRRYLNGFLLEITGQSAHLVATDGHRLAYNVTPITPHSEPAPKGQFIIPRKGAIELMRTLDDTEELITIEVNPHCLCITSPSQTLISQLIDGRFPDYQSVIPKQNQNTLIADTGELKSMLARASILCNENFKGIRLHIEQGLLKVEATNPEQEHLEDEISAVYTAAPLNIAVNVQYLLDALQHIHSPQVKLVFGNAQTSFRIEEPDSTDKCFVIMPLKL